MRSLRLLIVNTLVGLAQPSAVDVAGPGWPLPPCALGFDPVPAKSLKHLATP